MATLVLSLPPSAAPTPASRRRLRFSAAASRPQPPAAPAKGKVIRVSDPLRRPLLLLEPLLRQSHPEAAAKEAEAEVKTRDGGRKDEDDERRRYYVNMGYAIRTLREEFPDVFYKEPTFDIYREDIALKFFRNTFKGIENYKRIFAFLRFIGRIFFKSLWIDIVSIWQPVENVVMIRWIAQGVPRLPWEAHGRFDGTSEYKLDKYGKIYEHKVDNIALNRPRKFRVLPVEELISVLGCPSTPKPTYFEISQLAFAPYLSPLLRFTWMRVDLPFYIALALASVANG